MTENTARFEAAIDAIDAANAEDPNTDLYEGREFPKELLYAIRMTEWLERFKPKASEALRLAARAQHIRRWEIARSDYPQGRIGYLKWRTDLKHFHAGLAEKILREAGYDDALIGRVQALIRKERLKQDKEAQALEDVICLVFLENYFAEFSEKHEEEKVIDIVQKTWKKMSSAAQKTALRLDLSPTARALVKKAVQPSG
ncbi:MAG: DUF4202 domain-containing protein [Alphaproteobacteria bacterium]|nr:DUF4202 domain-containing protein [Alphaproteobacteria bacterium]